MIKQIFALLALVFVTSSCSIFHVSSSHTADEFYPAKDTQEIAFLEVIESDHKIIGDVIVNAERRQQLSDVIAKMKREAGILGGDAITNIRSDATGNWKKLPAQTLIGNAYVRANFSADVVVFGK